MSFLLSLVAMAGTQAKLLPNASFHSADDVAFQYRGRIGHETQGSATFYYAGTELRTRFTGRSLALAFAESGYGPGNSMGVKIDGCPTIPLRLDPASDRTYVVAVGLADKLHELEVYRRQDTYGGVATFKGLWLERRGRLEVPPPAPKRKMELFGDSVMGGTGSDSFGYEGKPDGAVSWDNQSGYLNDGYWGFGLIAARLLKADANVQGIGGLPLLDHTGWFGGALKDTIGLVSTWDKLDPIGGQSTPWDFSKFIPDVVIISIGQNDARGGHVEDGDWMDNWRKSYDQVLAGLRSHYPRAKFVLTTTILNHDPRWDQAIQQVVATFNQEQGGRVATYFAFTRTGRATPGHPRLEEQEEMGRELAAYLEGVPGLWNSRGS